MARRPFSSGHFAGERSRSVVAPPTNPLVPVAGAGPSPSAPTVPGGGGSPTAPPAPLPDYTNVSGPPFAAVIGVNKPAGATAGYSVLYAIGTDPLQVATSFPFSLSMGSSSQSFQLFANDTGFSQSAASIESWNSLFS